MMWWSFFAALDDRAAQCGHDATCGTSAMR
jgi:hypothetical protein